MFPRPRVCTCFLQKLCPYLALSSQTLVFKVIAGLRNVSRWHTQWKQRWSSRGARRQSVWLLRIYVMCQIWCWDEIRLLMGYSNLRNTWNVNCWNCLLCVWAEVGMSALCMHRIPLVCMLTVCSEFWYTHYNFHLKLLHIFSSQIWSSTAIYMKWVNVQNAIKWTMQCMLFIVSAAVSIQKLIIVWHVEF